MHATYSAEGSERVVPPLYYEHITTGIACGTEQQLLLQLGAFESKAKEFISGCVPLSGDHANQAIVTPKAWHTVGRSDYLIAEMRFLELYPDGIMIFPGTIKWMILAKQPSIDEPL
jgi:hypothetical protein